MPDIIHIEVTRIADRTFNAAVADIVRVSAVSIRASLVALFDRRETGVLVVAQKVAALGGADELVVRVVVAEVDVGFLLNCGIEPAIVHAEGDQVDVFACSGSGLDGGILLLDVVGEFGAIVSTVRLVYISFRRSNQLGPEEEKTHLGEDGKIAAFVLWELRVECLQQFPDVRRGGHCAGDIVLAVGEANANGLVNVQHVCVIVPAVLVQ